MAITVSKVFVAEILFFADLNQGFDDFASGGIAIISPWTGNCDAASFNLEDLGSLIFAEEAASSTAANQGLLHVNEASSVTELFMRGESDGTDTQMTSSGMTLLRGAILDEIPSVGQNLLRKSDFEQKSSGTATVAPDGWSLVGTPSDITVSASDASQAGVNLVKVTADAASEGISYTMDATVLKASTTYTVWGQYKVDAGDNAIVSTTGGSSNLSKPGLDQTAFTEVTGTFTTDSTPTPVVLQLLCTLATDVCYFDNFVVVEGFASPGRFVPNNGFGAGGILGWAKGTNSGTPAITQGSGFTTTVGDDGTGLFTLNWNRTLPDALYAVFGCTVGAANGTDQTLKVVSHSTTQIQVQTTANNSQANLDWFIVVLH